MVENHRSVLTENSTKREGKDQEVETSLVAQWLRLHAPNAGDLDLLPGQGVRGLPRWC